jgi:hypothetical protein
MFATPQVQQGRPATPTAPANGGASQSGPQPPVPGGAPQSNGAGPPNGQQGPQGGPQQIPPQYASKIDPNNPLQITLMQRMDKFTPQDVRTLQNAPQVIPVLKNLVPELGFAFDMIIDPRGPFAGVSQSGANWPQPGAQPQPLMAGGTPGVGAGAPPMGSPSGPPQHPTTKLSET